MKSGKKGTLIMVVRHVLTYRGLSSLTGAALDGPRHTSSGRSYAKEAGTPS